MSDPNQPAEQLKKQIDQAFAGVPPLVSQSFKMKLDIMILEMISEGKLPEDVAEELGIPVERVELAMQANYDADAT